MFASAASVSPDSTVTIISSLFLLIEKSFSSSFSTNPRIPPSFTKRFVPLPAINTGTSNFFAIFNISFNSFIDVIFIK